MRLPRQVALGLVSFLGVAAPLSAQDDAASKMPTWPDQIAKGFLPYHQLKVEDFRIDDSGKSDGGFWIKPFLHPYWHFIFTRRDWYYGYVDQWIVFSGFDHNASSRKSKFRDMEKWLPFAQAYLDLYEIHARQLAALKPGELPSGRGATPEEAASTLQKNLDAFLQEKYKLLEAETAELQKATDNGANPRKVREVAKAIRKRLDAIPPPSGPAYDLSAPPPSPTPSPSSKSP